MSANPHGICTYSFMPVSKHRIYSVFSQPTHYSAKQFVGQPSLHLYIQLSVFKYIIQQTNQSLVHRRIFTFSSQSNKKITGNLSVKVPSYNKASRHATGLQEFYNPVKKDTMQHLRVFSFQHFSLYMQLKLLAQLVWV